MIGDTAPVLDRAIGLCRRLSRPAGSAGTGTKPEVAEPTLHAGESW
jgi:hypothetical protein